MMKKLVFGVVIASVCVFLLYDAFSTYVSPYQSVSEIIMHSDKYVGENVRILGKIHDFKYTEKGSLVFNLSDLQNETAMINVIYSGDQQQVKAGRKAVVIGTLTREKTIIAEKLLMKCPSKYE